MRHRANPRFWRAYQQLPEEIRRLADKNYELLKRDPHHPSLHFKKVGRFWSARVGLFYRALAVEAEADVRLLCSRQLTASVDMTSAVKWLITPRAAVVFLHGGCSSHRTRRSL